MCRLEKIIFIIFIIVLSSCRTVNNSKDLQTEYFSSSDASWQFFNLESAIEVKVIDHTKNNILRGTVAVASVTIVINHNGEIFRVLGLCNLSDYKKDELITLLPTSKPDFNVSLPYKVFLNPKTNKRERFEHDKNILNTTYAHIEKITN